MSVRLALRVRAAWRHKLSLFWPQTRCRQVALYSLVVQSSLEFSLSLSFAFKYLINARAHFAFTFISGQLLIFNLQRHIFCNKHGTLINKTNKNTPLPCYKPNIKLQTCKMFKCKKTTTDNPQTPWHQMNMSKTNKARRNGIQLDVK